ncbi:hypothetical protein [Isoptericola croceus]|uniref:hypothetical protein n=1 Tax=Isoptericola croceus TaxID=3031406 RepID=UPI0023F69C21|nr:hypothetical protein [Isoptericola croceus]
MIARLPAYVATLACATIVLSACAGPSGGSAGESSAVSGVNVEVLRQVHFDFEPASTPEELVEEGGSEAIVRGRLLTVVQGGSIAESDEDDAPEQYVILEVEVEETYQDHGGAVGDGPVYVTLHQGPWMGDDLEYSIEHWNRALPAGTEMILYLISSERGMVRGAHGIPDDALGFTPLPQGMVIQDDGDVIGGLVDLESGWEALTWAELESQVEAASSG